MTRKVIILLVLALLLEGCVGLAKIGGGPLVIGNPQPTPTPAEVKK